MHEHALIAIVALLLNAALYGPRRILVASGLTGIAHLSAEFLRTLERKLNRDHRSLQQRFVRGCFVTCFWVGFAFCLGWMLSALLTQNLHFIEMLLVALFLPVRQGIDIALSVRAQLAAGNLAGARNALSGTAITHHAVLDEAGVCRATIELLAIQFSEKICAPLLWYIVLGLPGLLMSKAVYLLAENLSDNRDDFGSLAHKAHVVLHGLPTHLASVLWIAAAPFLPTGRTYSVWQAITPYYGKPPMTLSIASAATALNVALGGPGSNYLHGKWVGPGTGRTSALSLSQGIYLFGLTHLFLLLLLGVLM